MGKLKLQLNIFCFFLLKIRERQLNEVALYRSVDLSIYIYSKMFSNRFYRPSKQTAIKFCLGLKLNLAETDYLLSLAGYALSTSLKEDLVVRFCILNGIYNLFEVNDLLYEYCETTL